MNEDQIRQIVKDEMQKNYQSGNPQVPPHAHDGVGNLKISQSNIKEFLSLGNLSNGVIAKNSVTGTNFTQDFQGNPNVYIVPLIIGGLHSSFNGGNAPDGTLLVDATGGAVHLNVCIQNVWHSVVLT